MAKPGDRLLVTDGSLNRHETMTVAEFLSKPNRGATRAEVAAFVEAIVVHDIAKLIAMAIQRNNLEWERRLEKLFADRDAAAAKQKQPAIWTPP